MLMLMLLMFTAQFAMQDVVSCWDITRLLCLKGNHCDSLWHWSGKQCRHVQIAYKQMLPFNPLGIVNVECYATLQPWNLLKRYIMGWIIYLIMMLWCWLISFSSKAFIAMNYISMNTSQMQLFYGSYHVYHSEESLILLFKWWNVEVTVIRLA